MLGQEIGPTFDEHKVKVILMMCQLLKGIFMQVVYDCQLYYPAQLSWVVHKKGAFESDDKGIIH